ncbi:MAG: putative manganese-dependent inorganic diphosphatase [Coriobacteriales bacterium]|jgi:manganese-dependent inorganic pyrophosphatase
MHGKNPVVVVGHRNPDNDAICSAIGYAHLKNQLDPEGDYVAYRQGPLPDETRWMLERTGIAVPPLISHVRARVGDAMTRSVISVGEHDIMLNAGRKMREHNIRSIIVNGEDGKFRGIVSDRRFAELHIDEMDVVDTVKTKLKLGNVARACNGRIVLGDPEQKLDGHLRVAAAEPDTFRRLISPGDIVVMGDRYRTQRIAVNECIGCLVLAVGAQPDDEILEIAQRNGVSIICAEQDTFTVTRLATLAQTVTRYVDSNPLVLKPDVILSDVIPDILHAPQRAAAVVDDDGVCIGIISRTDIAVLPRRHVILVDHNERAQSVPGIDEAEVVEIVDHHRVGDIQTASPIRFLSLPWGSSATIVAEQYRIHGVDVPEGIARLLLSAIMTDTVLLKSPTTTDVDRSVAARLGEAIGCDPLEFGIELFNRRGDDLTLSMEAIVEGDSKEFLFGEKRFLISQHETVDLRRMLERSDEIAAYVEELRERGHYDVVLLMVTDIINAGSQLFAAGSLKLVERAFDIDLSRGNAWAPGILSRKKQVVSRLMHQQ